MARQVEVFSRSQKRRFDPRRLPRAVGEAAETMETWGDRGSTKVVGSMEMKVWRWFQPERSSVKTLSLNLATRLHLS